MKIKQILIGIVILVGAWIIGKVTLSDDDNNVGQVFRDSFQAFKPEEENPTPEGQTTDINQLIADLIQSESGTRSSSGTSTEDNQDTLVDDALDFATGTDESGASTEGTQTGDISGAADAVIDDFTDRGETLQNNLNDSVSLFTDVLGDSTDDDEESDPLGDFLP